MPGQSSSRTGALRWRLGALALLLGGLTAMTFLWQSMSEAGAPPYKPRVQAFFAKDQQLQVAVGLSAPGDHQWTGELIVALLDADGKQLERGTQQLKNADSLSNFRFDFKANKTDADKLQLSIAFGNKQAKIPVRQVLLGKAHETTLRVGTEFHAASQASLTCSVQGVRSIAETVPLVGSNLAVRLRDGAGKWHDLYQGKIGTTGSTTANFEVPSLAPGAYTLEIVTKSAFAEEKLERQVRIKADGKVLLVSDRPIYQPGHIIHLRALALRSFDMKPLENKNILFEVEDPKGNKVFKRSFTTSDFGIASVDFQLADEVNMGDYHLRAIIGDIRAEKTVQVKRYVLPKFKSKSRQTRLFICPRKRSPPSCRAITSSANQSPTRKSK